MTNDKRTYTLSETTNEVEVGVGDKISITKIRQGTGETRAVNTREGVVEALYFDSIKLKDYAVTVTVTDRNWATSIEILERAVEPLPQKVGAILRHTTGGLYFRTGPNQWVSGREDPFVFTDDDFKHGWRMGHYAVLSEGVDL